MGAVTISTEIAALLEQQVLAGRCESVGAFVEEAVRRMAEEADAEMDDLAAHVAAGDADIAAGRFVLVQTGDDERGVHERAMARLSDKLKRMS